MTPSKAHDDAWKRPPEHDEMVVGCMKSIEENMNVLPWTNKKDRVLQLEFVQAEALCNSSSSPCNTWGGRDFFIDILAAWAAKEITKSGIEEWFFVFGAYEIKPKIYSAGALLRQLRVQREKLRSWVGYRHEFFLHPIIRPDDPLVDTFLAMSEFRPLYWTGDRIAAVRSRSIPQISHDDIPF